MNVNHLLQQKQKRWKKSFLISAIALVFLSLAYLSIGEVFISPFNYLEPLNNMLLTELRLPRLFAALAIGSALAISGASLQVLLGNSLAEPGVLGISGGASLAMVVVLFLLPVMPTPEVSMLAAIVGSLCFTLIIVGMARSMKLSTPRLLLVGVALGILSGAVVTWAFYFSDDMSMRVLMYWLMGSIGGTSWHQHTLTLLMIPVIVWICFQGTKLDKLMVGETHAKQLGVNVDRLRWRLILAVSLLVGMSVALGGIISFVGLVVPHLLRLAFGTENKYLLPMSAIAGAGLLVFADILARISLDSAELPLGVVTTTIGAPFFIWMLLRNHDLR
ncbi:Vitamin B12 import system permease protein btuC [Vibrio nigripulchritudo SO65]|uniref:vitamin B12 ABC transporter permease BtuC n=1 Tax=Vibrio nigripulchritudo TaxID=28173 RepID=UPI0003B2296A|nr:vitamin B12 ABC transporter permease BtuC [Vibrio nigripulchritudo]KJY79686.1 Vitamin B12 import system permease BtuC [Vibrio nigripulchritudo]CCN34542.1 Vitamin B12 import system permease protein btuC [Vibrio nigripulchritudo AM115]CCN42164.1 Vitamin B12 import system permease protein btuC [Vibrio nigripulchritudo FTn2]CCN62709.1 Vitamin B12 import system permease protein btuC [Vibrio nigripulchritudo POn4]CCN75543.1 Vitamin B12 import system permease protein btuC [Vibrio nigripulchritudo 